MAARLNPRHAEMIRDKIQAQQLIKVLEDHAVRGKEMVPSRITAALGLLKKCVPDLSTTSIQGNEGGPLELTIRWAQHSK